MRKQTKTFLTLIYLVLPIMGIAMPQRSDSVKLNNEYATINLAAELSKHGYAHGDALSLIQAARLVKQLGIVSDDNQKTAVGGSDDLRTKTIKVNMNDSELLADAKALAKDNGILLALIDQVGSNVRGVCNDGNRRIYSAVRAHATDVYKLRCPSTKPVSVRVVGDGDTDLSLMIYDPEGNIIYNDDEDEDCIARFTPRWTSVYEIHIVNHGDVYNNYTLFIHISD